MGSAGTALALCVASGARAQAAAPPDEAKPSAPPAESAPAPAPAPAPRPAAPPPYPYPQAYPYPPGTAPPGYGTPGQPAYPPGYYPPPGYAPQGYPPGYGYPPPGYAYVPPGPAKMDYEEGKPVPPGYHVEERVRRGAIMAGAIMAGTTYAINVLIAGVADGRGEYEWLYVPVVGGWVYTSETCDNDDCSYLVLHNLTHTVGVILIVYGIAAKRKLLIRNDVSLVVAPTRVGSGTGIGVSGEF